MVEYYLLAVAGANTFVLFLMLIWVLGGYKIKSFMDRDYTPRIFFANVRPNFTFARLFLVIIGLIPNIWIFTIIDIRVYNDSLAHVDIINVILVTFILTFPTAILAKQYMPSAISFNCRLSRGYFHSLVSLTRRFMND